MIQSKRLAVCLAVLVCSQLIAAEFGLSVTRTKLQQTSKDSIDKQFPAVIPLNDLGDWRDAIENSLYIVLRKTDITRGAVTIRVADTGRFILFMDAGGIFVISTGVLDFIDDMLFSLIGGSSRRIKNMTIERENLLIPLAAVAAAHYTLDHQYTNYMSAVLSGNVPKARQETMPIFTESQNFEADRFACILLSAAGYERNCFQHSLQILESATQNTAANNTTWELEPYIQSLPPTSKRIAELTRMAGAIETVSGDITLAATNIKKGIGLKDSIGTLREIQQVYPTAICLEHFIAQGMHKQWMMAHPQNNGLLPLYAVGTYEISEAQVKPPVIADSYYRETTDFYQKLLEKQYDPYIASDCAFFLALSPDSKMQQQAVTLAESAAAAEAYDGTISRRANFAAILYMTGDTQRAELIMQQLLYPQNAPQPIETPTSMPAVTGSQLYAGYTGRLADAERNYQVILSHGKSVVPDPDIQSGEYPIRLRNIKINDTVDTLITQWGKPAEILYDFYTELWIYTSLNARITIADGVITRIEVSTPSPVSLPGDIRTGDRRETFENRNGKAVGRAYDYEIYKIGGQRLHVEYMSGKIRSFILCR